MSGSEPGSEHRTGVEVPPTTGEPAVDEALSGLADLDSRPLAEHPERLARAHEGLHEALRDGAG